MEPFEIAISRRGAGRSAPAAGAHQVARRDARDGVGIRLQPGLHQGIGGVLAHGLRLARRRKRSSTRSITYKSEVDGLSNPLHQGERHRAEPHAAGDHPRLAEHVFRDDEDHPAAGGSERTRCGPRLTPSMWLRRRCLGSGSRRRPRNRGCRCRRWRTCGPS